mgnify:FL=1
MTRRSIILHTLIFLTLFAMPIVAQAFSFSDILGDESLELYTPPEGSEYCGSAKIGNAIDQFLSGYASRLKDQVIRDFLDIPRKYARQLLICYLKSWTQFGTGSAGNNCTTQVGGSMETALNEQYKEQFKSDFITACEGRNTLDNVLEAGRRILMENGRDGGAVFVQDWNQFQANNRYRGLQVARNQMANTELCPWMVGSMQVLFNFDPAKAVPLSGESEDGRGNYTEEARCTMSDVDPFDTESQTAEIAAALLMPQNNIWGSFLLAEGNIQKQIEDEERASENEFVATGGIGGLRDINPATGTACVKLAGDGSTCLEYGPIVKSGAGVAADVQAQSQAQLDWFTNGSDKGGESANIGASIVSSMLSTTQSSIRPQYGLSRTQRTTASYTPGSLPSPTPPVFTPDPPGSGGAHDPVCTNNNNACTCVMNDPDAQILAQQTIQDATRSAMASNPSLISGGSVLPGKNALFIQAVCAAIGATPLQCHGSPFSDGDIVVAVGTVEYSTNIIMPDGVIRLPGQTTVFCPAGNL